MSSPSVREKMRDFYKGGFGDIAASVDTLTSNTARTDDDIQSLLDDAESQIQGYLDEYAE